MLFNPCSSVDFMPNFVMDGIELQLMSETRLLGIQISSNLKWKSNTVNMITKANRRLWIVRRLKSLGAEHDSLVDVYIKQVRSILEFGAPAWEGGITVREKEDIERVQRNACRIILGRTYISYEKALKYLNLEPLEARRTRLCLNFALKAESNPKFCSWFKESTKTYNTRSKQQKYKQIQANHARYSNSPIAYLTKLLNSHYSKSKP